jgi:hypothetical protein
MSSCSSVEFWKLWTKGLGPFLIIVETMVIFDGHHIHGRTAILGSYVMIFWSLGPDFKVSTSFFLVASPSLENQNDRNHRESSGIIENDKNRNIVK